MSEREQLDYMMSTEGWKQIETFLNKRIEETKNKLMYCPIEEVQEHRAKVNAWNAVFLHIKGVKEDAE